MVDIETLQAMPVFGGLSLETLNLILSQSSVFRKDANQYFFHEGELADALFVILEGKVVVKKDPDSSVLIGDLRAGDCFGEMGLIDHQPRSANVIAVGACEVLRISVDTLFDIYQQDIKQYAMLHMNLGREVSRRLRKADDGLVYH